VGPEGLLSPNSLKMGLQAVPFPPSRSVTCSSLVTGEIPKNKRGKLKRLRKDGRVPQHVIFIKLGDLSQPPLPWENTCKMNTCNKEYNKNS
jgi:hypothetical protein